MSYKKRFLHRQLWAKFRNVKKSRKIGQDEKTLVSIFASFLTTSTKV